MLLRTPVLLGCVLAFSVTIISAQNRWTVGRTADGHPDLQGIWADNTITPFERPEELAGREFLTDGELAILKQRAAQLFSGSERSGGIRNVPCPQ